MLDQFKSPEESTFVICAFKTSVVTRLVVLIVLLHRAGLALQRYRVAGQTGRPAQGLRPELLDEGHLVQLVRLVDLVGLAHGPLVVRRELGPEEVAVRYFVDVVPVGRRRRGQAEATSGLAAVDWKLVVAVQPHRHRMVLVLFDPRVRPEVKVRDGLPAGLSGRRLRLERLDDLLLPEVVERIDRVGPLAADGGQRLLRVVVDQLLLMLLLVLLVQVRLRGWEVDGLPDLVRARQHQEGPGFARQLV